MIHGNISFRTHGIERHRLVGRHNLRLYITGWETIANEHGRRRTSGGGRGPGSPGGESLLDYALCSMYA